MNELEQEIQADRLETANEILEEQRLAFLREELEFMCHYEEHAE